MTSCVIYSALQLSMFSALLLVLGGIVVPPLGTARAAGASTPQAQAVAFTPLAQGAMLAAVPPQPQGAGNPELLVISSQQEAAHYKLADHPALQTVDFTTQQVLLVVDQTRPTGGYSLQVTSISAQPDQLLVTATVQQPPPDAMLTMALTRPYQLVSIARQAKPVELQLRPAPPPEPGH